ncbi:MAG TPA: hypothetical protein VIP08_03095 [Phenylobacterium sp.]|uniref:hypothetical protein n=1 Tax=Phenylobacterium sp. TaxID=1871053 RepID=UPI002F91F6E4
MFDITGEEIGRLDDADLRTLVARLAQAEVAAGGGALSGVIAGGSQDAPDGGIDVRVEQASLHVAADFVPRALTGFQVKVPAMRPADIRKEMRPSGVLRPSIRALAARRGAYIIASAAAGVADDALEQRRAAMRAAVTDVPQGNSLHLDYYDRDRLATWASLYPGVAAWIRRRVGREIAGWRPIGSWRDLQTASDGGYLVDDGLTLIDERDGTVARPILEGIHTLRNLLRAPGSCIRLIGLSGAGKTRLVEALFEADVGVASLDPALAIYADYADETIPTAREMAQRLTIEGRPAILIVDNCNPASHGQLAAICGRSGSRISLLTVEYDIRDDEPEATQVFRLVTTSEALITSWLERDFPHVSQIDRGRVAAFSGGNFRVARALAGTIRVGESLGRLRDGDLFERIFHQRKDTDQTLLRDAQTLSLFYSFDATEGANGELAVIARFSDRTEAQLFESLAELQARGVLQTRGRWRAILPHAITNRLAAGALDRLRPHAFDAFCADLPERMLKSLSRRIGMLHDVDAARALAARWLDNEGPLGDLLCEPRFDILGNLAPLAPNRVLDRLEAVALSQTDHRRSACISLLKALAYEPELFARATRLLARMVADEAPNENFNTAREPLRELFHLYLSGTRSLPSERRALVVEFLGQSDPGLQRAGRLALEALLQEGHFSSSSNVDFGARPRDFGWQPTLNGEVFDWYAEALSLVRTHLHDLDEQRGVLADSLGGLWRYEACRTVFEAAASDFITDGGWLEGWSALRTMLRFDADGMPADTRKQIEDLIERLRPADLLAEARAYVLSTRHEYWNLIDYDDEGEDEARPEARGQAKGRVERIGRDMANEPLLLPLFAPEVLSQTADGMRDALFAIGLATGAKDIRALWSDLLDAFRGLSDAARSPVVLGNFLKGARERDPAFVAEALERALTDGDLAPHFAYLQLMAGLDNDGVERLLRAFERASDAWPFRILGRNLDDLAPKALHRLLHALAAKSGGVALSLDALSYYFSPRSGRTFEASPLVIDLGRDLLRRFDPEELNVLRDCGLTYVIKACLPGLAGRDTAREVCEIFHAHRRGLNGWRREGRGFIQALLEVQPDIALDVFVGGPEGPARALLRDGTPWAAPLSSLDAAVLTAWADQRPERYIALGEVFPMFAKDQPDRTLGLDPTFLTLLAHAPNKIGFLGDAFDRLMPQGWSGSLAGLLEQRRALLVNLPDDPDVQVWRTRVAPMIDTLIASERRRETEREESFE